MNWLISSKLQKLCFIVSYSFIMKLPYHSILFPIFSVVTESVMISSVSFLILVIYVFSLCSFVNFARGLSNFSLRPVFLFVFFYGFVFLFLVSLIPTLYYFFSSSYFGFILSYFSNFLELET